MVSGEISWTLLVAVGVVITYICIINFSNIINIAQITVNNLKIKKNVMIGTSRWLEGWLGTL